MHEGSLVEYHYYNVLGILLSKFSPKFSLSFLLNNKMKPSFYQNNSQRSMPPVHSCSVPRQWSTDCRPLPSVFWPSLNVLYDPQTPLPLLSAHGKKWTNSLKVFFPFHFTAFNQVPPKSFTTCFLHHFELVIYLPLSVSTVSLSAFFLSLPLLLLLLLLPPISFWQQPERFRKNKHCDIEA